ncbi:MAG: addiction module antidote protein, HigA family [Opitutus sp.]|nr:addiction module antidote protein, HigA family [Opitutus sp.]
MKTSYLANIHPAEILLHDFLEPMGITRYRLAMATGIPQAQVRRICAGRRAITVETAVRLGVFFGVDPRNWLNLQRACDLEEFERTRGAKVRKAVEKWAA